MVRFYKFTGNLIEVIKAARLHPLIIEPTLEKRPAKRQAIIDQYNIDVEKDLDRTSYVSDKYTVKEMQDRLRATDHLQFISYAQGNFVAAHILKIALDTSQPFLYSRNKAIERGEHQSPHKNISFLYVDYTNALCGLCFDWVRDDSNLQIAEADRKRHFSITIIRHVNADPAEREVMYIVDPAILTYRTQKNYINREKILPEIKSFIRSHQITQLIQPLILSDGSVNMAYYHKLDARIQCKKNLDGVDPLPGIKIPVSDIKTMPTPDPEQEIGNELMNDPEIAYLAAFHPLKIILNYPPNEPERLNIYITANEILTLCESLHEQSTMPTTHLRQVLETTERAIKDPSPENAKALLALANRTHELSPRRGFPLTKALLILAGFSFIALSAAATALSLGALAPISFFALTLGASAISTAIASTSGVAGAGLLGYAFFKPTKPQKSLILQRTLNDLADQMPRDETHNTPSPGVF